MIASVSPVKIIHAALDEDNGGDIFLRGRVAPESFIHLLTDDYQREVAPLTSQGSILEALKNGGALPDIELGMRGQSFSETSEGTFMLHDPVYIIDGLQRVSTAIHYLQMCPDANIRIGAKIRFATNKEWERQQFRILNTARSRVSPNIILRNRREESRALLMLYGLTGNTRDFALHGRVSWSQKMARGEMLTALTFAKVVGVLHSHKAAGKSNSIDELVPALDRSMDIIGMQNMRDNIKCLFDLVDECWGIRRVQYRESAVVVRSQFLGVLARLLSDHTDFWKQPDEKKLFVDASLRKKFATFPIHDPQVVQLSGSSGKSRDLLYMLLRDHVNSGKRTKRLVSRKADIVDFSDDDESDAEAA